MAASIDNHLGGFGGGRAYTGHYSGPAFGGGMEMMIPQTALSVKVEYLGFFFGTKNAVLMTAGAGNFAYSNKVTVDTWKVGLNYHFPASGCWFGHC